MTITQPASRLCPNPQLAFCADDENVFVVADLSGYPKSFPPHIKVAEKMYTSFRNKHVMIKTSLTRQLNSL